MLRLISLGSLAALFFSSTFVVNRALSLQGGHWAWTSSLRFGFMLIFLIVILIIKDGKKALNDVKDVFLNHWLFWVISGSIGFGVFYSLITFSSQYASGWVVATTWQATILATPVVIALFGRKVPRNGLVFTGIIFIGIVLVNIEHAALASLREVLLSALPVLGAAFAYPIGNQLVWESRKGNHPRLPHIQHPILDNAFARVLLLTLGSLPFWAGLLLATFPPAPSVDQLISTALVALLSGVIATTLFLYARHLSHQPYEIAAVDSTQSLEVVFSLTGEIVFLSGALPGWIGLAGILLTILGLIAYISFQNNAP
ncbi:MAG: multidrug resistance efflux transporter family protein [Anaerolineales bacterium]|jgi:drug/metabolite transporter (DMT)-like permease|nr:multidrug resistance efflux transporter family protein [Chloroflexota bacterium]MBK6647794.1 multidrug resistance efflux transporter family protein [Anaerolineales bacterium]